MDPCRFNDHIEKEGQQAEIYQFEADESTNSALADHLTGRGQKISYVAPRISREDACLLEDEFQRSEANMKSRQQRKVRRSDESKCEDWLAAMMRETPDRSKKSKIEYYREAVENWPNIGDSKKPSRPFERIWKRAIEITGSAWGRAGRKPKKSTHRNHRTK